VLTAHLPSTPASVEALPFVLNDLGVVREPRGAEYDRPEAIIDDYSPVNPRSTDDRSSTGGSGAPSSNPASDTGNREWTLVEPVPTDESVDHVWFGRGVPVGASKGTLEAFRNRLDQQEERTDAIDITVVCNDERMLDEHESLEAVYGRREDFPFEVTSHFGLSREGFATLLERDDSDFLHYIGHATPEGLRCSDGKLDVRDLDSVGVDVFFLNACDSYEQALALTERGALGGVGTLGDVVNAYAIEAGKLTAKLLNQGFPLRAAITLVRENTVIGDQYLVVGDGSVDVAQPEGGAPTVYHVETRDDGDYAVEATAYPTRVFRIGTYFDVTAESFDDKFLLPGTTKPMRMTESELNEYFRWFSGPVRIDGQLHWMDSLESPL
jgi:voltage-gated potassium channel Kch